MLIGVSRNSADPKLSADQQDKRGVIPLETYHIDQWLAGIQSEASGLCYPMPTILLDRDLFNSAPVMQSCPDFIN